MQFERKEIPSMYYGASRTVNFTSTPEEKERIWNIANRFNQNAVVVGVCELFKKAEFKDFAIVEQMYVPPTNMDKVMFDAIFETGSFTVFFSKEIAPKREKNDLKFFFSLSVGLTVGDVRKSLQFDLRGPVNPEVEITEEMKTNPTVKLEFSPSSAVIRKLHSVILVDEMSEFNRRVVGDFTASYFLTKTN